MQRFDAKNRCKKDGGEKFHLICRRESKSGKVLIFRWFPKILKQNSAKISDFEKMRTIFWSKKSAHHPLLAHLT